MADPKSREVVLYVQSRRAITSFYRPPISTAEGAPGVSVNVGTASVTGGETRGATLEGGIADQPIHFLSDDQARCVALTEDLAARRGYQVTVTDIGKAGRIERLVAEHLRSVQTFPVLIAPSGRRLEGVDAFTEERLCEIMPTDMKSIRAFTYLKVKGGDFDRIRDQLVSFPEIKELHFLTGDWDIFVVLEFAASDARKRHVLDFVTAKIRGLPEIIDTSTIVPEYSLTKFPQ